MTKVAVFAHYDADGIGDAYLNDIFRQLVEVFDEIIVVTTSGISGLSIINDKKVRVVHRDNAGYDFYSYKVGIDAISDLSIVEQLVVLNDSFYISPDFDIADILSQCRQFDIFSLTDNLQFTYHLQSYFLVFNKRAITSLWFYKFWNKVYTYKNKWKIVLDYEVGLTSSALTAGLSLGSYINNVQEGNICHEKPLFLYNKVGILKIDVIRNDIAKIDIASLFSHSEIISRHVERTKRVYENRLLSSTNKQMGVGSNFFEYDNLRPVADVAAIIHLYYIDLADDVRAALSKIPFDIDIYITVAEESSIPLVVDAFSGVSNRLCIAVTENKGRDVKPFLELLKSRDFESYKMVLKLHSKKSKYSDHGASWRKDIYTGLIPSSASINKLKDVFSSGRTGIAANFSSYLSSSQYWGANRERVERYCSLMNVDRSEQELFFVGGTMFWFSPKALYPLVNIIDLELFEEENGQQDGTLAHVFERLVCKSALSVKMNCVDILNPDINLVASDVILNTVKVLND
ncbi:rhamnan synthesis F family protein [Vibrio barjaei]|uniref:rhamnan synthesis F family protein n=1 Tax=Vibrio barjaei TaxID=1676683 RepID=UPI0022844B70|nr:rhamnan synthesis F family protein [Vibrio barjaei]MCY9872549.1 hypothetical protein [Vibrio barjaei]